MGERDYIIGRLEAAEAERDRALATIAAVRASVEHADREGWSWPPAILAAIGRALDGTDTTALDTVRDENLRRRGKP